MTHQTYTLEEVDAYIDEVRDAIHDDDLEDFDKLSQLVKRRVSHALLAMEGYMLRDEHGSVDAQFGIVTVQMYEPDLPFGNEVEFPEIVQITIEPM